MFRTHFLFAAILASATLPACRPALAQTSILNPEPTYPSHWPDAAAVSPGKSLLVVTMAKPGVSRKCRVQSLDPEQLVCSRKFGRKPVVFDRSQVATLISPGYRPRLWLYDPICAALAGGSIYGAVILTGISVLPAIGGVAMAVVVTFNALWLAGEANAEFGPDDVLYLKAGERLTVPLEVTP